MKLSQLLNIADQPATHVLLLHKDIIEHQEIAGNVLVHAIVPNLISEEVRELIISVNIHPCAELDDEDFFVSSNFNFDLKKYPSLDALEKDLLIKLQYDILGSGIAIGGISEDLVEKFSQWDKAEPLKYEAEYSLHIFDITTATLSTLKPLLKALHSLY